MLIVRTMILGLALALHGPVRSDELQARQAVNAAVADAWRNSDYARIDELFERHRSQGTRSPAGTHLSARVLYALGAAMRDSRDASLPQARVSMQGNLDRTQRWLASRPTSSVAAYAQALARIDLAFHFRGTGLAREVSAAGWAGFEAQIRAAAQVLDNDSTRLVRDEAWYYARLRVAQLEAGGPEAIVRLLEEATQRYPSYYDLYFAAVTGLAPKWGGSLEAMEWVADLAARRTQAADGESAYARVYWSVGQLNPGENLFDSTLAKWPRMKKGFEDLVQRHPDPWNLNAFAWYACMARDGRRLKTLFQMIGDRLIPSVWPEGRLARCQRLANEVR